MAIDNQPPLEAAEAAPAQNPNQRAQIEELRRLLLAPYLAELTRLQKRVGGLEQQLAEQQHLLENLEPQISQIVLQTLQESREQLKEAISPVIAPAIKTQVRDAREDIIDALYPVIGSAITKSIAEAMRGLVETIDQSVKKTFSFGGFKRKVKARVTGVSEGALALRENLPFSVSEVFLIHTETGLLISHISPGSENEPSANSGDRDLVSGMLTAIRDFVRESFQAQNGMDENSQLNQIQYGSLTILIEQSRYVYLAIVYAGVAPVDYPAKVREVLGWLHGGYSRQLRSFGETGDSSKLVKLQGLLYNLVVKNA